MEVSRAYKANVYVAPPPPLEVRQATPLGQRNSIPRLVTPRQDPDESRDLRQNQRSPSLLTPRRFPAPLPRARSSASSFPIVDFHVHINPFHFLKPEIWKAFERTQPKHLELKRYAEDPSRFLKLMDEQGVERACLINYVAPDVMGYPPAVNDWVRTYANADPHRLVPFGGFHPDHARNPKAEIEKLVYKLEMGGVKIHPPHSLLAPNAYLDGAKSLRLLYETCEREGVPVMFHTGTTIFPGARNKFGDPMLIDDVAVDFPKLKIVLAHGGRPLWMETATFLVRRHPHVWMDISSIPPSSLLEYFPRLEELSEKAIFGSDWPGPHVPGMRANAEALLKLPLSPPAKRRILKENAQKVLRRK